MKWFLYGLSTLPAIIFFGGWKLADWAYLHYKCEGGLKHLQACYAEGYNIRPFLEFGLFFGQLLWLPAILSSVYLAAKVYEKHNKNEERNL